MNAGEEKLKPLDWLARVRMALEAARGLAFLHAHGVLHCRFTMTCVVLDEQWRARVSDYGVGVAGPDGVIRSRQVPPKRLRRLPSKCPPVFLLGTGGDGYMDPLYAATGPSSNDIPIPIAEPRHLAHLKPKYRFLGSTNLFRILVRTQLFNTHSEAEITPKHSPSLDPPILSRQQSYALSTLKRSQVLCPASGTRAPNPDKDETSLVAGRGSQKPGGPCSDFARRRCGSCGGPTATGADA
eukprot:jgi/Mesen1/2301/ME000155S01393